MLLNFSDFSRIFYYDNFQTTGKLNFILHSHILTPIVYFTINILLYLLYHISIPSIPLCIHQCIKVSYSINKYTPNSSTQFLFLILLFSISQRSIGSFFISNVSLFITHLSMYCFYFSNILGIFTLQSVRPYLTIKNTECLVKFEFQVNTTFLV